MIEAVRDVRNELGCGLKEAKDVVDRISSEASRR
jgi:ribosomal protein L7/L12